MNKLLYRTEGSYNLLDSRDVSAQYVFELRPDAPKHLRRSFLIDMEKDRGSNGSALNVAYDLQDIINSYWIHSDNDHINELVDYLEKWEEKDKYDFLVSEKSRLKDRLLVIESELSSYNAVEWENWTPTETEDAANA